MEKYCFSAVIIKIKTEAVASLRSFERLSLSQNAYRFVGILTFQLRICSNKQTNALTSDRANFSAPTTS